MIPSRWSLGHRAETVVIDYLRTRDYRILAANLWLNRFEIDIVAQQHGLIAVVEVRTRGKHSYETGFSSISPRKRSRLLQATEQLWSTTLCHMPEVQRVRIDVASVSFERSGVSLEYDEGALWFNE